MGLGREIRISHADLNLKTTGYKEDMSKGKMLRFEDSLPQLPVPTLEETGKKYLKSLHPLLSAEEFQRSRKAVEEFVKPGGEGEPLQKRLLAKAADPKVQNWLYDWWNHAAYLGYRDPVVPYVSYFYSYRDDRTRRDPAKRAAAITTSALEFKKQVDDGSLEPEYLRKDPMAMSSYEYMFNCSRIPAEGADFPQKYPAQGNEHIAVMRKGQIFKVQTHLNGQQLNTSELQQQFEKILKIAEKVPAVGALTSENRDIWTAARKRLLAADPANGEALKTVESASFLVCLDDTAPVTLEERAHVYWHGDGVNRWYDKPLTFIINDNGTAGFLGEHSMMDGTPTHRLNDYVNNLIFNNRLDYSNPSIRSNLPEPQPINFKVDSAVLEDIATAQKDFTNVIAKHELRVQAFQAYGKGLIKKFKCSPDAYVQMLIQLAYFKMYGKNRPTYESASTRKFKQGRTETTRTVSDESVAFCKAHCDPAASREEVAKLFRAALAAHTKYIADASIGKGVDRHLFGLKQLIQKGEKVPALYQDPAYGYSGSWYLSTSQLSSEYFNGYGWSQVIDDGFGIAYMINENSIQFNIVSKRLGSERMSFYLNEAACEVRDVLMPELTAQPEKAKL
ncbi:Carnitine O-acetyltransferase mitochondrial [Ophidiomyces ophidiicola]|nr:Carnitine O-acetyltransferase mitochondrial [Ophidiomyces ophidiicola]KAI2009498.1 Carnitine O-acetyltransferase mitochondrial [Ophidiomyces ophidiicola]KAI2028194.1 Carnitine O-acetyltransferase mitochondrial [Ophidiomyces ophidiicola]KAI2054809.1 Carnitine O-acetyltransferase mitochondrial [Ophidiomyces ophidiicola]KAI2078959.1 Carnitine O-acetyltransferase mitochondrial [Ophidiomyces ophidiicola]